MYSQSGTGGNDRTMNDKQKRIRLSATDLVQRDRKVRELSRKALATVQGGTDDTGLKYKYKYGV